MKLIAKRLSAFALPALLLVAGVAANQIVAQKKPSPKPVATPTATRTPDCPRVDVSCPDTVTEGQPLTFTANVGGGDPEITPTFNWTISAGTIESGQGTSSITVSTGGLAGQTVTATVDVGGYPRECSTSNSCTTRVAAKINSQKFDEYGNLGLADEKARLDAFADALKKDTTLTGYIIAYGGRRSRPDEAQKKSEATGDYLIKTRGIIDGRVLIGVGGYRESPTVELWIGAAGAEPPLSTPTVDPSEVKPAGEKPPVRKKPVKSKKKAD